MNLKCNPFILKNDQEKKKKNVYQKSVILSKLTNSNLRVTLFNCLAIISRGLERCRHKALRSSH